MNTKRKNWKWKHGTAYLGSTTHPDATVYAALSAPRGARYRWRTTVGGKELAHSTDSETAQKLAREALAMT